MASHHRWSFGGDFLTKPLRDDGAALDSRRLQRWGPAGPDPYHLFVPPRPHLAEWLQRCQRQLPLEAPGTVITVCCVVERDKCSTTLDGPASAA